MYTAHDYTAAPTVVRICTVQIFHFFLIVASLPTVKYCAGLPMSSLKKTTWVKHSLRAIVSDMELYDGREACDKPIQIIDSFSWRIESIYRELLAAEAYGELTTVDEREILEYVEHSYHRIQQFQEQVERQRHRCCSLLQNLTPGVTAPINCDGSVGRPVFVVPCSVLQHLLEIHLTIPKLLGVSVQSDTEWRIMV